MLENRVARSADRFWLLTTEAPVFFRTTARSAGTAIAAFGFATLAVACDRSLTTALQPFSNASTNIFNQTNLVSDVASYGATKTDPLLVNPWGIAFDPTGALWVANNGSGTATTYDANGNKLGTTISIPAAATPIVNPQAQINIGLPTGIVYSAAGDFTIQGHGAATYIFAGEDGAISAWNASMGSTAQIVADRSANGARYKGLAMARDGSANRLYATNFKGNQIEVFDGSFNLVRAFTDSTLPAGFAPFGIATIGGQLYVTFAKQQAPENVDDVAAAGNGYVDVFAPSGVLIRRFASNGFLNSPWAIVQAPTGFGPFAGAILVGNFGDGQIGAYDAASGTFVDMLRDVNGAAISISGLWGLAFGPVSGSTSLYFAAGVGDEAHGLVGRLSP